MARSESCIRRMSWCLWLTLPSAAIFVGCEDASGPQGSDRDVAGQGGATAVVGGAGSGGATSGLSGTGTGGAGTPDVIGSECQKAGAVACSSPVADTILQCGADGFWGMVERCADGSYCAETDTITDTTVQCVAPDPICAGGATTICGTDGTLRTCDENGVLGQPASCPSLLCEAGACLPQAMCAGRSGLYVWCLADDCGATSNITSVSCSVDNSLFTESCSYVGAGLGYFVNDYPTTALSFAIPSSSAWVPVAECPAIRHFVVAAFALTSHPYPDVTEIAFAVPEGYWIARGIDVTSANCDVVEYQTMTSTLCSDGAPRPTSVILTQPFPDSIVVGTELENGPEFWLRMTSIYEDI